MGTIQRWLHDSTLTELMDFYVELKRQIIMSEGTRWRLFKLDVQEEIIKNSTLKCLRDIIESKLTNELYDEYINIYKEGETSATDFTKYSEFMVAKRRARELDLEDFFEINRYHYKEGLLKEEIEAEKEDTEILDDYNSYIEYKLKQELISGMGKKI